MGRLRQQKGLRKQKLKPLKQKNLFLKKGDSIDSGDQYKEAIDNSPNPLRVCSLSCQ